MLKALLLWETISSNFALNCWMLWLHCPSSIWAGSHPTSQKDMFQFWKKKNSRATIAEGRFILRMFKTRFLLHFLSIFYHNVVLFAEKGNRIKTLYIWCYLPPLARTLSNYAPLFHSRQYLNPAVRWVKLYLENVSTYSCTQKKKSKDLRKKGPVHRMRFRTTTSKRGGTRFCTLVFRDRTDVIIAEHLNYSLTNDHSKFNTLQQTSWAGQLFIFTTADCEVGNHNNTHIERKTSIEWSVAIRCT